MNPSSLQRFRRWVLFFAALNEVTVILRFLYAAFTSYHLYMFWQDWTLVYISTLVRGFSNYAVKGRFLHRIYLRAFLLLLSAIFLLTINILAINKNIQIYIDHQEIIPSWCGDINGYGTYCYIVWISRFTGITLGFVLIIEIVRTLRFEYLSPNSTLVSEDKHTILENDLKSDPDQAVQQEIANEKTNTQNEASIV